MREIKFRAWDESSNIMHNNVEFIRSGIEVNDWIVFKSDKQKLEDNDVLSNPYFQQQIKLMQYTGLKDENGVEIYEGDIAKVLVAYTDYDGCEYKRPSRVYNHKTKYVNIAVSFDSGTFILDTDYTDSLGHTLWLWTQEDIEVIGNIYENPELLKD